MLVNTARLIASDRPSRPTFRKFLERSPNSLALSTSKTTRYVRLRYVRLKRPALAAGAEISGFMTPPAEASAARVSSSGCMTSTCAPSLRSVLYCSVKLDQTHGRNAQRTRLEREDHYSIEASRQIRVVRGTGWRAPRLGAGPSENSQGGGQPMPRYVWVLVER